jgi:hypothetical protein
MSKTYLKSDHFNGGGSDEVCAKYGWTATNNGVTATLCVATQGVGSLTIGKNDFDCQIKSK